MHRRMSDGAAPAYRSLPRMQGTDRVIRNWYLVAGEDLVFGGFAVGFAVTLGTLGARADSGDSGDSLAFPGFVSFGFTFLVWDRFPFRPLDSTEPLERFE